VQQFESLELDWTCTMRGLSRWDGGGAFTVSLVIEDYRFVASHRIFCSVKCALTC
jgi:hypothetical protein